MVRVLVWAVVSSIAGCNYPSLRPLGDGSVPDASDRDDATSAADASEHGDAGDASCASIHVTAGRVTPTIEIVIDQSGSMNTAYGGTTRWNAIREALLNPQTGVLPPLASAVFLGATLYSSRDTGPCPVLVKADRALNNVNLIETLLFNQEPIQNTPTPEAIDAVIQSFAANPPFTGSPPFIVLATDGLPATCTVPHPADQAQQEAANLASVEAARRAFTAGIQLFFLFVGSDQTGTHSQQMANAGAGLNPATGNATVYRATDPSQLREAFNTIINGVRTCDLTLSAPVDIASASSGTVKLNDMPLTFGIDWALDRDGVTIHLVGDACTRLRNTLSATLDGMFPCGG